MIYMHRWQVHHKKKPPFLYLLWFVWEFKCSSLNITVLVVPLITIVARFTLAFTLDFESWQMQQCKVAISVLLFSFCLHLECSVCTTGPWANCWFILKCPWIAFSACFWPQFYIYHVLVSSEYYFIVYPRWTWDYNSTFFFPPEMFH